MEIIKKDEFKRLSAKHSRNLLIFIFVVLAFTSAYIYSFTFDNLFISLAVGIVGVICCVLFYFAFLFEIGKLLKLYKDINDGIFQEESYIFLSEDIATEHDGVRLNSINVLLFEDGQQFEKTLYFITALDVPKLETNQSFTAKTFRNIIIEIR